MKIVIALLENQKQISEERLKTKHYPREIEPIIKKKIVEIEEAIKILKTSERQSKNKHLEEDETRHNA